MKKIVALLLAAMMLLSMVSLVNAEGEMARAGEYMFRVVNDDLGICFKRLCDLIDALSGRM